MKINNIRKNLILFFKILDKQMFFMLYYYTQREGDYMYNSNSEIIKVNQYIIDHKKEFNSELASAIKECRVKKNLSLEELAERTMTGSSYIAQLENGTTGLTVMKFLVLCNALEISTDEILEKFLYGSKKNEDILYSELQNGKNISQNVVNYLKNKKSGY
jgi:transcriptional regulator with XRE-family HTH domain